jgi:hypothetical protein
MKVIPGEGREHRMEESMAEVDGIKWPEETITKDGLLIVADELVAEKLPKIFRLFEEEWDGEKALRIPRDEFAATVLDMEAVSTRFLNRLKHYLHTHTDWNMRFTTEMVIFS